MRSLMSKVFRSSILGACALIALGLLLIFQSEATIISISYVIGGILIAIGTLAILKYIENNREGNKSELDIIYGIVTIILGIIVISHPQAIASIIPFIIGILIIIKSASKLHYSLILKKDNNDLWKSTFIIAIVTTVCGVALVINPFKGAEFLTKIVGVLITVYSVLDIISTLTIKNTLKQIHTAIEDTIVDAEIIEEKDSNQKEGKKKKRKNNKED